MAALPDLLWRPYVSQPRRGDGATARIQAGVNTTVSSITGGFRSLTVLWEQVFLVQRHQSEESSLREGGDRHARTPPLPLQGAGRPGARPPHPRPAPARRRVQA